MSLDFDLDEAPIADLIEALVETFDFTLPTAGGETLGKDLAAQAADDIAQRSSAGLDVDGNPFKDNERRYADYKRRRYDVDRPGELGGQTLSLLACLGKPEVGPETIRMVHGLNINPKQAGRTRARNGTELKPHETEPTDTQKGVWLTEGGRPFYAIDADGERKLAERADATLADHLNASGLGGGP